MFDKKRCIGNIYFLAKDQGKKIGDIEKRAGVSAGYISRLNKEESNTNPGIEFLAAMATDLGVSLDALINYDFEAITPTESYIIKFVERLLGQTEYYEMDWKRDLERDLKDVECDMNGNPKHPLFVIAEHGGVQGKSRSETYVGIEYCSHFLVEETVAIAGDGYHTVMPEGSMLYLMKLQVESDDQDMPYGSEDIYELYLVENGNVEPLCHSGKYMDTPFAPVLQNLYQAVVESGKHAKIKPEVRSILDAFMRQTDPVEEKDPFTGDGTELVFD